jgi:isocitrate dehydrogenase (NAD+)
VAIEWERKDAGLAGIGSAGQALPQATSDSIKSTKCALKGPTTTPTGGGHTSANIAMRRSLDLFACIRPVRSIEGVKSNYENVDLVIFRENTEGLYGGQELQVSPGVVVSLKVVTERATRRIAEAAFAYARKHGRKRITVVHKANILKMGDGTFLRICQDVAKQYADVACDDSIVDATCMKLVKDPHQFDVLLMENLYGDILSDLCAGLVGGLGVVPGANIGPDVAVFEATHGAAPDIAGKGLANPTALLQSAKMMFDHLGETEAALRLQSALFAVLKQGTHVTRDLGGSANTSQFVSAMVAALK